MSGKKTHRRAPTYRVLTSEDCEIVLRRIKEKQIKTTNELDNLNSQLNALESQAVEIKKSIAQKRTDIDNLKSMQAQDDFDTSYLTKRLDDLRKSDAQIAYRDRCREFVSQYKWIEEGDEGDEEGDEDEKIIPHDAYKFLNINNGEYLLPSLLVASELIKLAHYIKATELIQNELSNNESIISKNFGFCDTYGEVYDSCKIHGEDRLITEPVDCFGEHNFDCCHKKFAYTLVELDEYFTLDTNAIVDHKRIN